MIFLGKFVFVALLQFVVAQPSEVKIRYDNYTVYRVTPKTENALNTLQRWQESQLEWNFWTSIRGVGIPVDIMVPPTHKSVFHGRVEYSDITANILINNVQEKIDSERIRPVSDSGTFDFKSYHTLDEIYNWLKNLPKAHPGKVKLINLGKTYENRDLLGVKISFKDIPQKAVFIEANIHALEWIAGAACSYILNEILTSENKTIRQVVESHDWYILPIANPDGYVHTHTTDRFWRKTRVSYGNGCYGADPNRNWAFKWGTGGTSIDPCSVAYQGPAPFSEPSTRALSEYISKIGKDLVAYISFHSYTQLLMVPYGYTSKHLDNYDQMHRVALKAMEALARRYNTKYKFGNIPELLYVASGTSTDWVKATYHTPIVFTYELRDEGAHGFLLPADQIVPTGEETLDSLLTLLVEGEKTIQV